MIGLSILVAVSVVLFAREFWHLRRDEMERRRYDALDATGASGVAGETTRSGA